MPILTFFEHFKGGLYLKSQQPTGKCLQIITCELYKFVSLKWAFSAWASYIKKLQRKGTYFWARLSTLGSLSLGVTLVRYALSFVLLPSACGKLPGWFLEEGEFIPDGSFLVDSGDVDITLCWNLEFLFASGNTKDFTFPLLSEFLIFFFKTFLESLYKLGIFSLLLFLWTPEVS
jgi:hypothetical protein